MHVGTSLMPVRVSLVMLLLVAPAMLTIDAVAHAATVPPRSEWRATSSSDEVRTMVAAFAIDGDDSTRWGGTFSPGRWLQIDLGRATEIGGALIRWDHGFAAAYQIEASVDGRQ
jgi:hypothetical protein